MDGGLEPLGFGHFPLVQREPLDRPAVREVGTRLMAVIPGDPADAEDSRAVAGQDGIAPAIPLTKLRIWLAALPTAGGCPDIAPRGA